MSTISPVSAIPSFLPEPSLDVAGSAGQLAQTTAAQATSSSSSHVAAAPIPPASASSTAKPASAPGQSDVSLLVEHDKQTDRFTYKFVDSTGKVIREVPQESLADYVQNTKGGVVDTIA